RFIGTIRHVVSSADGRAGAAALLFTEIEFPDGARRVVNAVPYPLDLRSVSTGESGYLVSRSAAAKNMMFIGSASGGRISRADVLPNGRVRLLLDPDADVFQSSAYHEQRIINFVIQRDRELARQLDAVLFLVVIKRSPRQRI